MVRKQSSKGTEKSFSSRQPTDPTGNFPVERLKHMRHRNPPRYEKQKKKLISLSSVSSANSAPILGNIFLQQSPFMSTLLVIGRNLICGDQHLRSRNANFSLSMNYQRIFLRQRSAESKN